MVVAVAVAVAVSGAGAVAVAVAGLTKRFFNHCKRIFQSMFGVICHVLANRPGIRANRNHSKESQDDRLNSPKSGI